MRKFGRRNFMELYAVFSSPQSYNVETTAGQPLGTAVHAEVEIPEDVQPIPGAVNEEFRNCEAQWPAGYELTRSGPEARALRDIYGLVRTRNVILSKDCTCIGKVANWEDVGRVADALRKQNGVERLGWQHTKEVAEEADRLTAIAETMCGGSF